MDGGLARNDTRAWQLYTRMHILLSLSRLSWLDFFVSLLAALLSHSSHSFPATGPSAMKLAKEKKKPIKRTCSQVVSNAGILWARHAFLLDCVTTREGGGSQISCHSQDLVSIASKKAMLCFHFAPER